MRFVTMDAEINEAQELMNPGKEKSPFIRCLDFKLFSPKKTRHFCWLQPVTFYFCDCCWLAAGQQTASCCNNVCCSFLTFLLFFFFVFHAAATDEMVAVRHAKCGRWVGRGDRARGGTGQEVKIGGSGGQLGKWNLNFSVGRHTSRHDRPSPQHVSVTLSPRRPLRWLLLHIRTQNVQKPVCWTYFRFLSNNNKIKFELPCVSVSAVGQRGCDWAMFKTSMMSLPVCAAGHKDTERKKEMMDLPITLQRKSLHV